MSTTSGTRHTGEGTDQFSDDLPMSDFEHGLYHALQDRSGDSDTEKNGGGGWQRDLELPPDGII